MLGADDPPSKRTFGDPENARGLIEAARGGDRAAAEEIQRLLLRFARQACRRGPWGADLDCEDVAQEAGRRLYERPAYRGVGTERAYLYSIVKTTVIDVVRRSEARKRWHRGADLATVSPPPNPGDHLDVQRILAELDEECRRLLACVYLDGVGYAALSDELRIEEVSVRSRVSRCMKRARKIAERVGWR